MGIDVRKTMRRTRVSLSAYAAILALAGSAFMAGCSDEPSGPGSPEQGPPVVQYVLGRPEPGALNSVTAAAGDADGNVYVVAAGSIVKFNPAGAYVLSWPIPHPRELDQARERLGIRSEAHHYLQAYPAIAYHGGTVHVAMPGYSRIYSFSTEGELLNSWGGTGASLFRQLQDFGIDAEGTFYVLDSESRTVRRFSATGDSLGILGARGTHEGAFEAPNAMAVDPVQGTVYVSDIERRLVQEFDRDGVFLRSWNFGKDEQGREVIPVRLAVDRNGDLLVLGNPQYNWPQRIQKFSPGGVMTAQWFLAGARDDPDESDPSSRNSQSIGLTVEPSGRILVSDVGVDRVYEFSAGGQFLRSMGRRPGSAPGELSRPRGVAVDNKGQVYVLTEDPVQQLVKYSRHGEFLGNISFEASGIDYPRFLARRPSGGLYVIDSDLQVSEIEEDGRLVATWELDFPDESYRYPNDFEVDRQGNLIFLFENGLIQEYNPDHEKIREYTFPMRYRGRIAAGRDGTRLILHEVRFDFNFGPVYAITTITDFGELVSQFSLRGGLGTIREAADIAVDRRGDVYVLDSEIRRVAKFSRIGSFLTRTPPLTSGDAVLDRPHQMVIDRYDALYILDYGANQVVKLAQDEAE